MQGVKPSLLKLIQCDWARKPLLSTKRAKAAALRNLELVESQGGRTSKIKTEEEWKERGSGLQTSWFVICPFATDILPLVNLARRLGAKAALMVTGGGERSTRQSIKSDCQNPLVNCLIEILGSVLRSRQLTLCYIMLLAQDRVVTLFL